MDQLAFPVPVTTSIATFPTALISPEPTNLTPFSVVVAVPERVMAPNEIKEPPLIKIPCSVAPVALILKVPPAVGVAVGLTVLLVA